MYDVSRVDRNKLKQAYINWMKTFPNKYHLTLTLREGTSDCICMKHLDDFIKRLNQRYFGRRYKERGAYFAGFVARERTVKGTLHFHILLSYESIELKKLQEGIDQVISSFLRTNRYSSTKPIFESKGVMLQEYYDNGDQDQGLESYLMKALNDPHSVNSDPTSFVGLLSESNVEFGSNVGKPRY